MCNLKFCIKVVEHDFIYDWQYCLLFVNLPLQMTLWSVLERAIEEKRKRKEKGIGRVFLAVCCLVNHLYRKADHSTLHTKYFLTKYFATPMLTLISFKWRFKVFIYYAFVLVFPEFEYLLLPPHLLDANLVKKMVVYI